MFNKLEARVLSEYKRSRAAPSTFCTLIKHYFSFIKHYIKTSNSHQLLCSFQSGLYSLLSGFFWSSYSIELTHWKVFSGMFRLLILYIYLDLQGAAVKNATIYTPSARQESNMRSCDDNWAL
jgi:hypothetical protein